MSDALVSVIIPTYYRNAQLQDAIESVRNQEYKNTEIIVVDDSGEGFARSAVEEYDIQHYVEFEQNKGNNNARNAGIERARGKYFQMLDDDDELYPTKISKQVALLEERDEVEVVYCGIEWESRIQLPDPEVKGDILEKALAFDTGSCNYSTMLIEREALLDIMPLKQRRPTDFVTIIDLARRIQFDYVNEPSVKIGESPDSGGSSIGAARGREQIIRHYAGLYERFDPIVKKEALANAYTFKGMILLRSNTWSPVATKSFAEACYHSCTVKRFMRVIASLFGMPGFKIAKKIYETITGTE